MAYFFLYLLTVLVDTHKLMLSKTSLIPWTTAFVEKAPESLGPRLYTAIETGFRQMFGRIQYNTVCTS